MKSTIHKIYFLGIISLSVAAVVSCSDDDLQSESNDPMRMFTPLSLSAENFETESRVMWKASLYTEDINETYTAEVSTDSLFANPKDIILSKKTDSASVVLTDQEIPVRKNYFVRVKTNTYENRPESYWSLSKRIKIVGIQILHPVYEPNVSANQATLSWDITPEVTQLRFQPYTQVSGQEPVYIGDPIVSNITANEASSGTKTVDGLSPNTRYIVEIYKGNTSVGSQTLRTKPSTNFSLIVSPTDDLVTIINNAPDGAVIGLNPGTYNTGDKLITINGKAITLASTSGNSSNTKIAFKEFTLNNTGAGLQLKNLELDGTINNAAYLINLTSGNNNADKANFGNVLIENCIVHGVSTSAFRANRGPNSGYAMDKFEIKYSVFKNFAVSSYGFLHLDKLVFNEVNIDNSTFTEIGDLFIRYRESITTPSANATINVNNCTINSIGFSQIYPLLDNFNVPIKFNFTNNILANTPRVGGSLSDNSLIRIATNSTAVFSFNNFYNLTNGKASDLKKLTLPTTGVTNTNNQEQPLNWTNTTIDFKLPTNSPLRTASSTGGAIGDSRWWN
ncbi:Uncharacterised protein [Algoriella xinjiangensis]|uniref:DUF4957 domain-containing protein n=1 Tax=Algoriella xinjiangensis TaxID=684065 RepID=UPI000F63A530|nr:DUF4957 domain-containing protein [Algoriella xinjiangensis]VDH16034.1 Uncharacterised protein [Algoriella xinjiangensis]